MAKTIVQISEGKIRGREHTTPNEKIFYGFHGIPYAEPPTGPLRFKDPVPSHKWQDIKDVSEERGIGFAQYNSLSKDLSGTETLTLNVYTPKLKNSTSLLPVMVYIHGGGFQVGTSGNDFFGPDYLIEKEVVVVSVQYRLGVFGFLSLELADVPGNAGLKDQVLALKWVQRNIHAFSGDSSNVTIFGTSAGGASVEYHIVSSMSKNLFHKAMANSGVSINPWAFNVNPKKYAIELAKYFGKNTEDDKELLDFLISIPSKELACGVNEMDFKNHNALPGGFVFSFAPVIEKKYANVPSFLSENPLQILKSGKQNNVPLIVGICEKEGLLHKQFISSKFKILIDDELVTPVIPFAIEDESLKKHINEFYSKYESKEEKAIVFLGDMDFRAGIILSAKLHSCGNPNIYLYNFKYDGGLNGTKRMLNISQPGAAHGDQEGYISFNRMYDPAGISQTDVLVRERLVQMLTNFAKTGNPTPKSTTEVTVTWPSIKKENVRCLNIDDDLKLEEILQDEWADLWERIYEHPRI